jgi:hypothetical protein
VFYRLAVPDGLRLRATATVGFDGLVAYLTDGACGSSRAVDCAVLYDGPPTYGAVPE